MNELRRMRSESSETMGLGVGCKRLELAVGTAEIAGVGRGGQHIMQKRVFLPRRMSLCCGMQLRIADFGIWSGPLTFWKPQFCEGEHWIG
jgi:hypothetical protein